MSAPAAGYWSTQGIALAFKINTSFMLVCAKACATISENTKMWKSRQALYTEKYDLAPVKFQNACVALVQHVISARLGFGLGSLLIWIGEELISKLMVQEMNSFKINNKQKFVLLITHLTTKTTQGGKKTLSGSASHYKSCTSKNWHTEPDNLLWKTKQDFIKYTIGKHG